jgi:hypothetical protein
VHRPDRNPGRFGGCRVSAEVCRHPPPHSAATAFPRRCAAALGQRLPVRDIAYATYPPTAAFPAAAAFPRRCAGVLFPMRRLRRFRGGVPASSFPFGGYGPPASAATAFPRRRVRPRTQPLWIPGHPHQRPIRACNCPIRTWTDLRRRDPSPPDPLLDPALDGPPWPPDPRRGQGPPFSSRHPLLVPPGASQEALGNPLIFQVKPYRT